MVRTGKCPKCDGADLFLVGQRAQIFATAELVRCVCMTCGFTEEWLPPEELGKLRAMRDRELEKERKRARR